MKKLTLLVVALVATLSLSAQQREWRTISASTCIAQSSLSFTNGKQYTPHLYFGFGSGIDYFVPVNINVNDIGTGESMSFRLGGLSIPVFMDGKWRLFDTWISPSLRCRAGAMLNVRIPGAGGFVQPELGVDISRYFTLALGWHGQVLYTMDYGWTTLSSYPNLSVTIRF